jgi:hypothetical protein
MTIFRVVSGLVIAALLGGIVFDLRRRRRSWHGVRQFVGDQARIAAHVWRERKNLGTGSALDNFRRIAYGLSAGFFVLLALTGFSPVLVTGEHLSGFLLIVHVTVAPLFALSLSALALLWAHRLRFDEEDWRYVLGPGKRRHSGGERRMKLALKVGFWMVLVFSLPLMGTIILGLFPLFGTEGEAFLTRAHGYSAILLLVAALTEIHLTIAYVQRSTEHSSKEHTS